MFDFLCLFKRNTYRLPLHYDNNDNDENEDMYGI